MSGTSQLDRTDRSSIDGSRKRKRVDETETRAGVKGAKQRSPGIRENDASRADRPSRKQRPPHPQFRAQRFKSRYQARNDSADQEEENVSTKKNRKSKRDRKENPSSRIHSLKKLLSRGTLPPPVQAEKERELETLLFERERNEMKKTSKRTLERYHFVRFLERQKAQKALKRLQKLKASAHDLTEDDDRNGNSSSSSSSSSNQRGNLDEQIEEAEVNYNYTIYAPLGEKYISIFADQSSKEEREDDEDEDEEESKKQSSINERSKETSQSSQTPRPPIWYEVQAAMKKGQRDLEKLRDRQPTITSKLRKADTEIATKSKDNTKNKSNEKTTKLTRDRIGDGGDGNSSRSYRETTTIQSRNQNGSGDVNDDNDSGDDMSDGDGGFFEKR